MAERAIEDQLREEYFDLLPDIRRVLDELEAEVRHGLIPVSRRLQKYDRLVIMSRVKECESAIDALRRRQEGRVFDRNTPELYTLRNLKDLAGIRISVFPRSLAAKVSDEIRRRLPSWESDPVMSHDRTKLMAEKYFGYCDASTSVRGEVQIVPMLTALFWEVEHATFYKPSPRLIDVLSTETMRQHVDEVLAALEDFEQEFEKLIRLGTSQKD